MSSAKDRLARILAERKAKAPEEPKESTVSTVSTGSSETTTEVPTAPKPVTQVVVPGTSEAHPLAIKLWELEEALDKQMPDRAQILKQIHDSLKEDPSVVTLLTDEAIGIIVKGLTDHTNTTIVAAPKKATTKRTQPLSLDLLD